MQQEQSPPPPLVFLSSAGAAQTFRGSTVGQVQGRLVEQKYPNLLTEECKVVKPDKVLKYGTAGESASSPFEL